jgi:hypothetical protein
MTNQPTFDSRTFQMHVVPSVDCSDWDVYALTHSDIQVISNTSEVGLAHTWQSQQENIFRLLYFFIYL